MIGDVSNLNYDTIFVAGGFVKGAGAMMPINRYATDTDFMWCAVFTDTYVSESYRNKIMLKTTWKPTYNSPAYVTVQYTKK